MKFQNCHNANAHHAHHLNMKLERLSKNDFGPRKMRYHGGFKKQTYFFGHIFMFTETCGLFA